MASISEDKIRQMEQEMSRFEKEISGSSKSGSGKAQLHNNFRGINKAANSHQKLAPPPAPSRILNSTLQPPPKPNFAMGQGHLNFMPHQLKSSGMSNMPSMMNNSMFGMPQMNGMSGDSSSTPAVITAKPTIYAAKPTLYVTKSSKSDSTPTDLTAASKISSAAVAQPSMPEVVKPIATTVQRVGPTYPQVLYSEKKEKKYKKMVRTAGGQTWEDNSLQDWDPDDFRVFCGDLGNDVTDEVLTRTFSRYPSFVKARVIRDKRTNKTKGYGFLSFKDPQDFIKAMKDMNGKYVGSRPIKLRKSSWRDRNIEVAKKKAKEKQRLGLR